MYDSPGSLKDRHIENKDILYAIFTPKENLQTNIHHRNPAVRCHIMLKVSVKYGYISLVLIRHHSFDRHLCLVPLLFLQLFLPQGNFDISVNLTTDTIKDLRRKLANESGIPARALHWQ